MAKHEEIVVLKLVPDESQVQALLGGQGAGGSATPPPVPGDAGGTAQPPGGAGGGGLGGLGEMFGAEGGAGAAAGAGALAGGIAGIIGGLLSGVVEGLIDWLGRLLETIKQFVGDLKNYNGDIAAAAAGFEVELIQLKLTMGDAFAPLMKGIYAIGEGFLKLLEGLAPIIHLISSILGPILELIGHLFGAIGDALGLLLKPLELIAEIIDWFIQKFGWLVGVSSDSSADANASGGSDSDTPVQNQEPSTTMDENAKQDNERSSAFWSMGIFGVFADLMSKRFMVPALPLWAPNMTIELEMKMLHEKALQDSIDRVKDCWNDGYRSARDETRLLGAMLSGMSPAREM